MEQLLGAQQQRQQHHQPHRSLSPRTPTRPHLQHIPSSRFRDHHHHPQPHGGFKILRITPPFFLLLLAAVYLLASFIILSAPAPSLRPDKNPNRLILHMAAPSPPPSPELFELDNGRIRARITNVGATLTSLLVPDKNGVLGDVVLGFDSLDPYLNGTSPYFGCIVGRVANRIKDGEFTLNGVQHSLATNNPPNTLHGGFKGFDKVIWEVTEYDKGKTPSITLKYYSKDGEEGFPGDVSVAVRYSLVSNMALKLEMEAVPLNKATPISLAQHTYWNLAGHNSGHVLAHSIQIHRSQITPVDQTSVPTGEFMPVSGTPFDFLTEHKIGDRIAQVPGGYDHNYVLGSGEVKSGLQHVAKVTDPSSLRVLNIWADAPGVQFYTGNFLNGVVGKGGVVYGKHAGLCLETQGFPNAVNQPNFPSVVVHPVMDCNVAVVVLISDRVRQQMDAGISGGSGDGKHNENVPTVNHCKMSILSITANSSIPPNLSGNEAKVKWQKPPPRHVELNADASFHNDVYAGSAGAIICDFQGRFVAASCVFIPHVAMAKAMAMREGLTLVNNLGFSRVQTESDSLEIIDACNGGDTSMEGILGGTRQRQFLLIVWISLPSVRSRLNIVREKQMKWLMN